MLSLQEHCHLCPPAPAIMLFISKCPLTVTWPSRSRSETPTHTLQLPSTSHMAFGDLTRASDGLKVQYAKDKKEMRLLLFERHFAFLGTSKATSFHQHSFKVLCVGVIGIHHYHCPDNSSLQLLVQYSKVMMVTNGLGRNIK